MSFNDPLQKIRCAALICLLLPAAVCAHDNWIAASDYFPEEGEEIMLHIGNGHNFPESDSAISERFVETILVTAPDGNSESIEVSTDPENNRLISSFPVGTEGVYIVSYSVKRPRMEEPLAVGSAAVIPGNDSGRYTRGEGLEISPTRKLSGLRAGDKLPLVLLLDGERIAGVLNVTPEKGRSYSMRTTAGRPAEITVEEAGHYLVVTSRGGQTASFTLSVRERADESG